MISYAQNFEDVMLARAFPDQRSGFYIDIGVWHPTADSVTKHFYDLGWSGVNVEALPEQHRLIADARPRDININAAASSQPGPLRIHRVKNSGLSTSSVHYAKQHLAAGFSVEEIEVATISLADVCARHAKERVIDFLKIDVEGAEADVIRSGDWRRYRPKVVVVEATVPNSPQEAFADWEPILVAADYTFCYFDGLNRWYHAAEESRLREAFYAPPNPFDKYTLARVVELQHQIERLNRAASSRRTSLRHLASWPVDLAHRIARRFSAG